MIIDFKKKEQDKTYLEQLKLTADKLSECSSQFFDLGLHLALTGKWKEWSDSMPIGSEVHFDDGMLLDTGDDIITRIIKMRIEIDNLTMDIDNLVK